MPLVAVALAGCANTSSAPKSVTIAFKSPVVVGKNALPTLYTCDGKDISPPVEWGPVPASTKELALFVLGLTPKPHSPAYTVSVEWAVAGVNPALHRIAAGQLPAGAHVGSLTGGKKHYSICPKRGKSETYQFALYAVPAGITVAPKFAGFELLHALADPTSATATSAGGAFVAVYKRR
jgi:hypothetical protein